MGARHSRLGRARTDDERLLDLSALILLAGPLLCAAGWALTLLDLPPMPWSAR